jgi:hypothetical protein
MKRSRSHLPSRHGAAMIGLMMSSMLLSGCGESNPAPSSNAPSPAPASSDPSVSKKGRSQVDTTSRLERRKQQRAAEQAQSGQ